MLNVTLKRSSIGCNPKQRRTLQALGLRKIRQTKSHDDNSAIRGMIDRVKHLVEVTES